jgi:hypothetical protein
LFVLAGEGRAAEGLDRNADVAILWNCANVSLRAADLTAADPALRFAIDIVGAAETATVEAGPAGEIGAGIVGHAETDIADAEPVERIGEVAHIAVAGAAIVIAAGAGGNAERHSLAHATLLGFIVAAGGVRFTLADAAGGRTAFPVLEKDVRDRETAHRQRRSRGEVTLPFATTAVARLLAQAAELFRQSRIDHIQAD